MSMSKTYIRLRLYGMAFLFTIGLSMCFLGFVSLLVLVLVKLERLIEKLLMMCAGAKDR
jgi:hypothetical protein